MRELVELPPVQFLGAISYSVYLWHWPLIILLPFVLETKLSFWHHLAIIGLSVLLGAVSKYLV